MFFFAALTFAGALLSPQPQQQTSYDGNSIADCLKHVRQHDLGQGIVDEESFVEPLARAKIVQAAPDIEALFAQSKDDEERAELASVLVRLSVKDDLYWNTLVSYAQPALDNDFPDSYDMATADDPKPQFTPAFLTKAKEHGMSTEQAFQYVYFFLPNDLTYLAKSGDPRGIPLLRKVLSSPLSILREVAADGLAECQDIDSVPVIIAMTRKATEFEARMLAYSLLFFNDPRAEAVAQQLYVPKDQTVPQLRAFLGGHPFTR